MESLGHNALNGATGGIWRVSDAVVKLATPPGREGVPEHWLTSAEPGHWNFWRREALAYGEGLAQTAFAAGGIRAPALLDTVERPDGAIELWLERVDGVPGPSAPPALLGDFAERLGAGHASWLGRRPAEAWLSRDWLRAYTTTRPAREPIPWDHPIAAAVWPDELRAGLRRLWQQRYEVLRATDDLPQTLCHHDVWPMNLIFDDAGPVLFDWSFVGPGPLGEDAANLVLDTFFDGLVDVDRLDEVVELVVTGYERGLSGVVDRATIRRAIHLTGAAKYFWLAPMMLTTLGGSQAYDRRDVAERFAGRRRPLELVVAWSALGEGGA